jgi:uncharacterized protein YaaN involved in tellurite resistance
MMKQEFEKRIGLVITNEEYAEIEAAYMGLPESVNKDKFVKIWLREGGIQDLFDKRAAAIQGWKNCACSLEKDKETLQIDVNELTDMALGFRKRINELEEKLSAINAMTAA